MKWGYILGQKLESERLKNFAVSTSLQTKAIEVNLEYPGLESIPQVPGNRAEVDQIHDARNVVSATVSVLMWSVTIFRPTR